MRWWVFSWKWLAQKVNAKSVSSLLAPAQRSSLGKKHGTTAGFAFRNTRNLRDLENDLTRDPREEVKYCHFKLVNRSFDA